MENCSVNCPYKSQIDELKRDSQRNSEQHREFYKRFNDVEKAQAISDERYNQILTLVTKIDASVDELKEKPGKKWDSMVIKIIGYVVTAVLAYLLAKVGLTA